MKQTVEILSQQPGCVVLMNAMASLLDEKGDDIVNHFNISADGDLSKVEVEVKVNGVPVPFMEAVNEGLKKILDSFDKAVEDRAVELLTKDPDLYDLHCALQNIDWRVRELVSRIEKREVR